MVTFINLDKIKFIIQDACGLDVAYAYEDLVFAEHGLFIIQCTPDQPDRFGCWFQKEMDPATQQETIRSLKKTAELNQAEILFKGIFEMDQKDGSEEIDIVFTPGFQL